ncbi:DUF983 domain-containing protein [Flavobacteriales bacterium]|jgi:hypothetical protein|nr:DUF983 domain-containing protein [Flavobacteriales bacterium]
MFKKGSKIYSIFKRKCPVCQEGDFFLSRPYDLKNIGKIHDNCENCNEKFSKEPGFYYGAMYVSYGLGVALFITVFLLTYLIYPKSTAFIYISIIAIAMIVLGPFIYELSKIIWANMFMSFKNKK